MASKLLNILEKFQAPPETLPEKVLHRNSLSSAMKLGS